MSAAVGGVCLARRRRRRIPESGHSYRCAMFLLTEEEGEDLIAIVYGATASGGGGGGAAVAGVAALALSAAGLPARGLAAADAAPAAVLRALAAGRAHVALLAERAAAAPPAPRLRDAGLEELGDAAPPARRACAVTGTVTGTAAGAAAARSLLDLADPAAAARYRLPPDLLPDRSVGLPAFCKIFIATPVLMRPSCFRKGRCQSCKFVPEWCTERNSTCATILTTDDGEVGALAEVVRRHELHAEVIAVEDLHLAAERLPDRALVLCSMDLPAVLRGLRARTLGPPPCEGSGPCAFEPYRLIKIANMRALARHPSAVRALTRLTFSAEGLRNLTEEAARTGPEEAARAYVAAHPATAEAGEARVAVLLPASTAREAYDARSLALAAALAERDAAGERRPGEFRFKVETFDDGCSAPRAYKYLTDALGTGEYGALAALAGPACGAAFADVARQAPALALPLLAYTPQAASAAAGARALLAAGDARHALRLVAALAGGAQWRHLALLADEATRAAARDAALLPLHVDHAELGAAPGAAVRADELAVWARRVAGRRLAVLVLALEDAREARAALCAGRAAGLVSAVWLFTAAAPAPAPHHRCSDGTLVSEVAERHFHVAPVPAERAAGWARRCGCAPEAATLYDVLRAWHAALRRLLAARPAALDDLHRPDILRSLIEDVTTAEYVGVTGKFEWTVEDGAHVRALPLALRQWQNGSYAEVGRWEHGALRLDEGVVRWGTADGRPPSDGSPPCALQALADALGADCAAAGGALAALALALLASAALVLAARARRARRRRRARAAALRLRPAAAGLARWELPRHRVVINRKLGTGAFGTVYGGHALLAADRAWTAVAVKTLKANATTEEKLDFLSEAEAMKRFDHENVVRLLGVVTKTEPVCTVMEYMLHGDLKSFLLARRHLAVEGAEEVAPRRLTGMARDAARALAYLARLRYVHRDVAARNCLVSARGQVKLADFGMTRLVFDNDYYRFSRKGMLPVRWMAPESLALGVFSPASDVWSFGVLLYEIVTFGSLPFQGLSNSEVLARVKAGHTLELPSGIKPQLEALIKSCWRQEARARPAAAALAAWLGGAPRLLAPVLDLPLDSLAPLLAEPRAAEVTHLPLRSFLLTTS
ncbi:hypothetical protein ACJJTC_011703 [Scirpophaga incertulas]